MSHSIITISRIIEATLLCPHMTVCLRSCVENSHTDPANMLSSRLTFDVIDPFRLLLPLHECVIAKNSTFVLVAREVLMIDSSAFKAN